MALAKHTHAKVRGVTRPTLLKVLGTEEAALCDLPAERVLVWDEQAHRGACGDIEVSEPKDAQIIRPGDVIRLRPGASLVSVLYRRGSASNVLFTTERCNSLCLMCSQPPRDDDDRWRVDELIELVGLIDQDERQLGVTGGEPTLLGDDLVRMLKACASKLPETELHVLTNGRHFAEREAAERWVDAGGARTTWAVPIYADGAERHDEIVGAFGAFGETMNGLAELARLRARVEIRIVLHALSVVRLTQLADFIYRRLPFVEHVTFMGLEPMGLAKLNRERLWVDPADFSDRLEVAVRRLADRGLNVSIYNLPLCVLPRSLWPFARQSISDWKNSYLPACERCAVRTACAGFFVTAGPAWRSRSVTPIIDLDRTHALA